MTVFHNTFNSSEAGSLVILRQLGVNHGNVLKAFHYHHHNSSRHKAIRRYLSTCRLFPCCLCLLRARLLHLWTHWADTQWLHLTRCQRDRLQNMWH